MKRFLLLFMLPVVLVAWGRSALFSVDQGEYALVTRFGSPRVVYDGSEDAGLHVKLPWPAESVRRIDRRLQVFDLPPREARTRDRRGDTAGNTITAEAYVCWRVPDADAAGTFVRACQTPEQARRLLEPVVGGRLGTVLSNLELSDLVREEDDPAAVDARMESVRRRILGEEPVAAGETLPDLREQARREYGIEVVDVRLKRFNYPAAVRDSIAERIRSERQRKVAEFQSMGELRANAIKTEADAKARITEEAARAKADRMRGEADAEADRVRGEAQARDPEFYAFLRKLKAYRTMLGASRDVLLLSTRGRLFDLLLNPPSAEPKGK